MWNSFVLLLHPTDFLMPLLFPPSLHRVDFPPDHLGKATTNTAPLLTGGSCESEPLDLLPSVTGCYTPAAAFHSLWSWIWWSLAWRRTWRGLWDPPVRSRRTRRGRLHGRTHTSHLTDTSLSPANSIVWMSHDWFHQSSNLVWIAHINTYTIHI